LEWASARKVVTEITGAVEHVRLCGVDGEAKLLLICPASSNTLGKVACGIDDTPVTTCAATALGSGIPVVIVPAMHVSMYYNPVVVENIKKLKKQGIIFIDPEIEENKAKLPDQETIIEKVLEVLG
jgi:phosphopantothenoylcysteine decarboxylase/phosphopantothenate--cysteine ligase